MKYVTFGDLVFKPHFLNEALGLKGLKQALIFFDNGWGLSVIKGDTALTNGYKYEYAVLTGTKEFYSIEDRGGVMYTDSKEEITKILNTLQIRSKNEL